MRTYWIAWALTLGFALTVLAGPMSSAYDVDRTPGIPVTQEGVAGAWPEAGVADRCRCDNDYVTIGLAVRWGYLDDPAVAALEGRWRWSDANRTGGGFLGVWHLLDRRIGGALWGEFRLPDDGRGAFRGGWNVSGSREGGALWGVWFRTDRMQGIFDGHWNFADGRDGGALAGAWAVLSDDGGVFSGHGIAAPSIQPVDWDGFLQATDGAVRVVRTVRWESGGDRRWGGEDFVYPQQNRKTVEWRSTTTVNWDGLVFALRIPKVRPIPHVTLHTDQISFTWEAPELLGLHLRQPVDRAGHAIEVRGFLLERRDDRDYARIGIGLRWGFLDTRGWDEPARNATDWTGGARISDGALGVLEVLSFERGDYLARRDNRQTVPWTSHTTTGWDGLRLVALVPLDRIDDATFALKAGAFQHTFTLRELAGDHIFDVDDAGHQVQVRAVRL